MMAEEGGGGLEANGGGAASGPRSLRVGPLERERYDARLCSCSGAHERHSPPCVRFFGDARALPVRNKGPAGAVRGNRAKAAGGLLGSEASVRAYRALERRLPGGLSARASRVG